MIGIIISIISIIISIIVIVKVNKSCTGRARDEIQRYKEIEFQKEKEKYIEELDRDFSDARQVRQEQLLSLDKEIENKKEFNNSLLEIREKELNSLIEEKRKAKEAELDRDIEDWAMSAQEAATWERDQVIKQYEVDKEKSKEELQKILSDIEDYRKKRDVINQEILRSRALEEKQDFYRIQLPESSKEDINFLLSIVNRFNNKEAIYKLIWSEYIQKPFKNMLNRVLSNKDPKNVIYMIKNMDTNEIYIGKTKAEVSKRWTEHIKTSLNIGTISRTNIHKALFNNWDKFTFTILEEVPVESSLNEREKYYIKFYESDIFGYNIKSGG